MKRTNPLSAQLANVVGETPHMRAASPPRIQLSEVATSLSNACGISSVSGMFLVSAGLRRSYRSP